MSQKLLLIAAFSVCLLGAQDNSAFLDEARSFYTATATNILQSAEEMPAEEYNFRPTPSSLTFAQLIREAVISQAESCSAVDGKRFRPDSAYSGSKDDVIAGLRQSASKCESAYASVNNFTASQEVGLPNQRHTKLGLLFLNASRLDEMYGRVSVYLRLKGLVPPSNRARLLPVT